VRPHQTEVVTKGTQVAPHITIDDDDDRPERMVRDPDRYFADARQQAEQDVRRQAGGLLNRLRRHGRAGHR
jgi:hypothetical protein